MHKYLREMYRKENLSSNGGRYIYKGQQEEQAKSGYSLSEQIRACRGNVRSGYGVFEYVDEGISGEFLDRPALTQLRNDVRDGIIDRVICLDPDRLSRKLMNQFTISEELEKKAELSRNGLYGGIRDATFFGYEMDPLNFPE